MAVQPRPVICEHCDSIHQRNELRRDEIARCTRCGAVLYRSTRLDVDQLLALTLTGAIVFVIANASPVIRIAVGGMHNDANLLGAIGALFRGPSLVVALVAAATLFVVPLLQIVLLGWVLLFARRGRRAPGFGGAMRALHWIRPWSMTEVFLLGVLVAIVKLSGLLHVIAGPGTWATAALTVLITVISKRDVRTLWDQLPAGGAARAGA
ncbi:paraquat-inducible protein A [Dokdonella sp.]|uniref:paraquat-inducible protein A n=1 Tax=Dokdonella sp. TaxID=2291710 RepID=UPI001B1C4B26|nr:paraquat-inducible protein A [Dokdonella sp.]MBO9664214.1 paraquat-inducible protein A [Dokdonella sp.]